MLCITIYNVRVLLLPVTRSLYPWLAITDDKASYVQKCLATKYSRVLDFGALSSLSGADNMAYRDTDTERAILDSARVLIYFILLTAFSFSPRSPPVLDSVFRQLTVIVHTMYWFAKPSPHVLNQDPRPRSGMHMLFHIIGIRYYTYITLCKLAM